MVLSFLFGRTRLNHLVSNVTDNVNTITDGCLKSIGMISHRLETKLDLLINTIIGFVITCSLSLLLYLTDFSPILRTIVWFLFISVCFYMIRNYITHSNSKPSPRPGVLLIDSIEGNRNIKKSKKYIYFHPTLKNRFFTNLSKRFCRCQKASK